MAEFVNAAATLLLAWVLLMRGHKGFGRELEGGEGGSIPTDGGSRVAGF